MMMMISFSSIICSSPSKTFESHYVCCSHGGHVHGDHGSFFLKAVSPRLKGLLLVCFLIELLSREVSRSTWARMFIRNWISMRRVLSTGLEAGCSYVYEA